MINNTTSKTTKNQNRRAALGRPAIKLLGGRSTLALGSVLVHKQLRTTTNKNKTKKKTKKNTKSKAEANAQSCNPDL